MIDAINDKVVGVIMKRGKTSSGIIIPEAVQEPQAFCKVISVGKDIKSGIKVGDIVVSHIRAGMDVVIEKELIKVLKEDEIYGTLTDKKTLDTLEAIQLTTKKESTIVAPHGAA
jgi:co-chaperonin GroES (HSP10)